MTETYEFTPSTPARRAGRQGAGRKPEPNPFESAVREIAGTGQARDTYFVLDTDNDETLKQRKDRIRRFLTRAGKVVAEERGVEPLTVELSITPAYREDAPEEIIPGVFVAKFWDRQGVKDALAQ